MYTSRILSVPIGAPDLSYAEGLMLALWPPGARVPALVEGDWRRPIGWATVRAHPAIGLSILVDARDYDVDLAAVFGLTGHVGALFSRAPEGGPIYLIAIGLWSVVELPRDGETRH